MIPAQGDVPAGFCVNHPKRETALRCSKCERFICTRCAIPTPVGMRCAECAQLRRLPQFDVGPGLLAGSTLAGLGTSVLAWFLASLVPFLSFFLAIFVGAAIGEVMSRAARRRSNRLLDVAAVVVTMLGFVIVEAIRVPGLIGGTGRGVPVVSLFFTLPVIIACVVAVLKLR